MLLKILSAEMSQSSGNPLRNWKCVHGSSHFETASALPIMMLPEILLEVLVEMLEKVLPKMLLEVLAWITLDYFARSLVILRLNFDKDHAIDFIQCLLFHSFVDCHDITAHTIILSELCNSKIRPKLTVAEAEALEKNRTASLKKKGIKVIECEKETLGTQWKFDLPCDLETGCLNYRM